MLLLESVEKSLGENQVIARIDLQIEVGSTTVLIGPSGCGKSTILRLMLGLLSPDRGRVLFDGQAVAPQSAGAMRQRVGYVIQDGGLFAHMTGRQNVTLMARQLAWPRAQIDKRLDELAELTQFPTGAIDRYPIELSGGQRQRLALMRALMLDPDVLLLDEPLAALDPMIRHGLQTDLRKIFAALGKTAVMVTHDLAEAAYFCDSIVLLRDGRIVQSGTIRQMLDEPADAFVTQFVNAQRSHLDDPKGADE